MSEPIVTLARTAGFCFGVSRAVALCDRLLDEGRPIATLGPIIHNEQVVGRLAARGCVAVNDPAEAPGARWSSAATGSASRSMTAAARWASRWRTPPACSWPRSTGLSASTPALMPPSLSRGTGITPKCREFSAIAAATASFLGVLPNFRQ